MNYRAVKAAEGRADLSPYLFHMCRDDRDEEEGMSAYRNFRNILTGQHIAAMRPHCMHKNRVWELDKKLRLAFDVVCLSSIPLDQMHHMLRSNGHRDHNFSQFGFVFRKDRLLDLGVQKAINVSSYLGRYQNPVRRAFDAMFEEVLRKGAKSEYWPVLPLVNAMHERYDFEWEREWRHVGHFRFDLDDLVCVILPEEGNPILRGIVKKLGVRIISPGWDARKIDLAIHPCKKKRLIFRRKELAIA